MSEDITHFGKFSRVIVRNMAKSDEQFQFDGTRFDWEWREPSSVSVMVSGDALVLEIRKPET